MLADMANMTLLRPITVSVFGTMGEILGRGGKVTLRDKDGNIVNNPDLPNASPFVPNSFYSDISNTINETMASWFPGTFGNGVAIAAPSLSGVSFLGGSAVSAGGYAGLGGVSFMNGTAGAVSGLPAGAAGWSSGMGLGSAGVSAPATGLSSFTSTITPYLGAAGLGSMGYQMLGGMIGLEAVVKDIQVAIGKTAQEAMADVDLTSMYNFDLGTSEGMDKAVKAVTAVKDITEATKEIAEPTSQFVEQAKAAKKQMDAWATSMEEYGVVAEYAAEVVDEEGPGKVKFPNYGMVLIKAFGVWGFKDTG